MNRAITQRLYDNEGRLSGTKSFARRIADNNAARIWMQPGTNSSVSSSLGRFLAGDVVTATVRFKAEANVSGAMFLGDAGGPDPYDNSVNTLSYGTRTWWAAEYDNTSASNTDAMAILYLYLLEQDQI